MFRLNDYGEGSELYKYLSSIASNTIYEALNEWVQTPDNLQEVYIDSAEEAGFESIFFWDDDYSVFFAETGSFQEAVEELIGGAGATMGYSYENIAEIFTDPGYEVPLHIIGTKAAYELREENMKEQMRQMPFPTFPNTDPPKLPEDNDNTLPFS